MITTVCTEKAPVQKRTGAMQRLPPRRGKLSAKRTDEGRVCRNCPIAGLLLRWGRACPARGLLAEGLGPLCEGAPPAGGGGESLAEIRNISGNGKVLSLRPLQGGTALTGRRGGLRPHPALRGHLPPRGKALVFQIARKPLPTISLLFTIVIKAWSSRPRTCRRSFWAWPRVRTVVSTHFSSWV